MRITVPGESGQIVRETLPQQKKAGVVAYSCHETPISKIARAKSTGGVA
jgi:hypothetical protein